MNVLSLNDPDFGTEIAVVAGEVNTSVSLLATNGTITITTLDGITITSGENGSKSVGLSGTYADINAALLGFTFTPDPDFYGLETILVTAEDGVTKNLEINVLGQNDPVDLSFPGEGEVVFTEPEYSTTYADERCIRPVDSALRPSWLIR